MTYDNITGLYRCPFCGAHSPIDYGLSCGCLYDDIPRDTIKRDPISNVDWHLIKDTFVGYCDDADVIASIKDAYTTTAGSDFITFSSDNNPYKLYF